MKHPEIEKLAKDGLYEIIKFPAYFPDKIVMDKIRANRDTNVMYYIALMNGIIPLVTLGNYKAFVANIRKKLPNTRYRTGS